MRSFYTFAAPKDALLPLLLFGELRVSACDTQAGVAASAKLVLEA